MFLIKYIGSLLGGPSTSDDVDETDAEFENRVEQRIKQTENTDEEELLDLDPFLLCLEDCGNITQIGKEIGMINDTYEFSLSIASEFRLEINDKVRFLALKNRNSKKLSIKKILAKQTPENDLSDTNPILYECCKKIIPAYVTETEGLVLTLKPQNIKVNLNNISPKIYPVAGDWLSLNAVVKIPELNTEEERVIFVESVDYARKLTAVGVVSQWNEKQGLGIIKVKTDDICIYFDIKQNDRQFIPEKNKTVKCDAVECNACGHKWRAIALYDCIAQDEKERIETKHDIKIQQNISFGNMLLGECKNLSIDVTNIGEVAHTIVKCGFSSKRSENQIKLLDKSLSHYNLQPNKTVSLTFQCTAKYTGRSKETFVFTFEDFEISQQILLNISSLDIAEEIKAQAGNNYKTNRIYPFHDYSNKVIVKSPRVLPTSHFVDIKLQTFFVPSNVKHLYVQNERRKLENLFPSLLQPLNAQNYCDKFHALIYLIEISAVLALKKFNNDSTCLTKHEEFLCLEIEGLSNYKPIIKPTDTLKVDKHLVDTQVYEGSICKIIGDKLLLKFDPYFHSAYKGEEVSVDFSVAVGTYTFLHNAVKKAFQKLGPTVLFPNQLTIENNIESHTNLKFFNPYLNDVQKTAVTNFLRNKYNLPYVIFGPPGTGKTVTLVEAVLQAVTSNSDSRIIITTPSNSAANNIMELLLESNHMEPGTLIRLVSYGVASADNLPEHLKPYCALINTASESLASNQKPMLRLNGILYSCPKSLLGRHKITISTLGNIAKLMKISFPKGHFTHLFIDEAGQAIEPEIMIAFTLLDKNYGRVCIAGDPKQLGPVILSQMAKDYGLEESFLERILSTNAYKNDSPLVIQLVHNYRSLSRILETPNKLFYNNSLISNIDPNSEEVRDNLNILMCMMSNYDVQYNIENYPGVFFHGIRGTNYKENGHTSWVNLDEAIMVFVYTSKLYKNGFCWDDIGIITPYVEQVRHIRRMFEKNLICPPKIGTVEEFQGQERKIIIISVVRSIESVVTPDISYQLGFISNPKRVNVALTRTKLLTIIFGNPHLLCLDPLWCSILRDIIKNNGYIGCNLPFNLERNDV